MAPLSGSLPRASWTSSERAACSSESTPPSCGAVVACSSSPMNLIASSRIDFSFRPRSSRSESAKVSTMALALAALLEVLWEALFEALVEAACRVTRPVVCSVRFSLSVSGVGASSRSSLTGDTPRLVSSFSSLVMHCGKRAMPSHLYREDLSLRTTSKLSSTFTMSSDTARRAGGGVQKVDRGDSHSCHGEKVQKTARKKQPCLKVYGFVRLRVMQPDVQCISRLLI
eukprot:1083460-Pleurochrysis_carterae.AAC.1